MHDGFRENPDAALTQGLGYPVAGLLLFGRAEDQDALEADLVEFLGQGREGVDAETHPHGEGFVYKLVGHQMDSFEEVVSA